MLTTQLSQAAPPSAARTVFECVEGDLLRVALQPIVDSSSRCPVAAELLLRPVHPGVEGPSQLVEMAVETGNLGRLTQRVLELAGCVARERPHQVLFVNLHPLDLQDPRLPEYLEPLLESASRIVLEITEAHRLTALDGWNDAVRWLRQAGFGVALDDLGEGYASLATMAELRPQVVKLGASLVRACPDNPLKRGLLETIADLCRRFDITTVAEGIETELEAAAVQRAGIVWCQGYLFGRPRLLELRSVSRLG